MRLRKNPYAYARVSAMKGKIIRKSGYDQLLKMKIGELTRWLSEGEYKRAIEELGVQYGGAELIERALNKNLEAHISKLKKITDEGLRYVIDIYLKRYDLANLKTLIRGKHVGVSDEEIVELLNPIGHQYDGVLQLELAEILKSFGLKNGSLPEIEGEMDKRYIEEMLGLASKLGRQAPLFVEFVKKEADVINIMTILRLRDIKSDKISSYLFPEGDLDIRKLKKLIRAENPIELLEQWRYVNGAKNVSDIETRLNAELYKKVVLLSHQNPLSIEVLLGYMFAKEMEIKNLQILVKGKQLDVPEEVLEKGLVIGKW